MLKLSIILKITVFYVAILLTMISSLEARELDSLEAKFISRINNGKYEKAEKDLLQELSQLYVMQDQQRGINSIYRFFEIAYRNKLDSLIHDGHNQLGYIYLQIGNTNKALENFLRAGFYYEKYDNTGRYNWLLVNVGNIYYSHYDYKKAIKYYNKAIDGFAALFGQIEKLDTIKTTMPFNNEINGIAVSFNNIALCYRSERDYKQALLYHKKALRLRQILASDFGIAHNYSYIGYCFSLIGENDSAIEYYSKSLDLFKDLEIHSDYEKRYYRYYLAENYLRMGMYYTKVKDYNKALSYYDSSYTNYKTIDSKVELIRLYLLYSELYLSKGDTDKALEKANHALDVSTKQKYYSEKINSLRQISEIYSSLKNYQKAFYYARRQHHADSLLFRDYVLNTLQGVEKDFELMKQSEKLNKLQRDYDISELELSRQNIIIISLASISLLILLGMATIYYFFKQKNRTAKLLEEKNQQLFEANKKLLLSEAKLEQANENLRQKNITLEQSDIELRELNATKDKFFSIIAHDLRGPISTLMNVAELVHNYFDEMDESEKKDFILEIKKSASGLYSLLENLLTWSRTQRGAIEYQPDKLELHRVIQGNFDVLNMSASNKKILLKSTVSENIVVFADNNLLTTVIRNIISNAIKFTNENGEIIVSASLKGNYYEIIIKDTGVGMAPEKLENLFSVDKSAVSLGTAGEKGTGLGLVICKEFIEMHGGTIRAESTLYKGTSFIFTVPRYDNSNEQ